MDEIDLQKFRFARKQNWRKTTKQPPPRHNDGEKFLKGPIPLKWIIRAGKLPGKTTQVAIALWYWAGRKKNRTILLSNITLIEFGISRYSKMRALRNLERAGLIIVERNRGCAPIVTILDVNEA